MPSPQGRRTQIAELTVYHDARGRTLPVRFDRPDREYVCEEIGDEVILLEDPADRAIGFEKLNNPGAVSQSVNLHLETTPQPAWSSQSPHGLRALRGKWADGLSLWTVLLPTRTRPGVRGVCAGRASGGPEAVSARENRHRRCRVLPGTPARPRPTAGRPGEAPRGLAPSSLAGGSAGQASTSSPTRATVTSELAAAVARPRSVRRPCSAFLPMRVMNLVALIGRCAMSLPS
jgi:hypothetical protein